MQRGLEDLRTRFEELCTEKGREPAQKFIKEGRAACPIWSIKALYLTASTRIPKCWPAYTT